MTRDPHATHANQSLAQPFPQPGRLVEHAYWELQIAASGTPEQVRALGDLRRLPRPWDPPTCTHPDLRLELWIWLDAVVTWLNHEYVWDAAGYVPTCWPEHPHIVHDLAVLADQRRRACHAKTSDALEDWHRYALPAFLDRMNDRLKSHCENGHQNWPAIGRHSRHTSDPAHRARIHSYKTDADLQRPNREPNAPEGPNLVVVQGDVIDGTTGEVID